MYGLFVLYRIQKAPETCGHSIDVRDTVPGIYESLRPCLGRGGDMYGKAYTAGIRRYGKAARTPPPWRGGDTRKRPSGRQEPGGRSDWYRYNT